MQQRLADFLIGLASTRGRAVYRPIGNTIKDLKNFQVEADEIVNLAEQGILRIVGKPHRESSTAHSFIDLIHVEVTNDGARWLLENPRDAILTHDINQKAAEGQITSGLPGKAKDNRNVFVVHGRNLDARNSLFRFLRSIGLRPLEWSQAVTGTGEASPFIGNILDVAFSMAQAIVVLLTPDDEARLREPLRAPADPPYESQLTGQARPNVLFEAGMAMGHNPSRTIIVELGTLRPFSDIAGRHTVRLSNTSAARQELAQRLETAGCAVDLSGRDWHTEGDFNIPETNAGLREMIADKDARLSHVVAGREIEVPAKQPPPVEDEYDENDIISMLAAWLRSKKIENQGFLVTYADVDRDVGLKLGTAKTHIKAAVSDLGLYIEREGKNTVTVRRRISIA